MQFEEIIKIDRHPFPEEWEETFYEQALHFGVDEFFLISILLVNQYFQKFNELYGTKISLCEEKFIQIPGNISEFIDCSEYGDWLAEYNYNCEIIFEDMANMAGFEIFNLPIRYDEEYGIESCVWELQKQKKKRYLKKFIHRFIPSWHPLIWRNLKNIEESFAWMEVGDIFILRNKSICDYKEFCNRYQQLVESYLKKERKVLDDVIGDLNYPLHFTGNYEEGYLGQYYYIYFDIGSNGYEYLDFMTLNFHWLLSCFVFCKLWEDFKEKVQRIFEMEPALRKIS